MSLCTRVPATGAGTPSQKPCIGNIRTCSRTRSGHFRRLFGSLAIPTSWYSASSPVELLASWYSASSPGSWLSQQASIVPARQEDLPTSWYCTSLPGELPTNWYCTTLPGELPLSRRALGKLALYQFSGSWQAGIFLPACQEATLEVLPASWYSSSLPGGSPNKLVLRSAHQESPEYSAPACWGSSSERFCRVGIWRVPAAGTRLFFHLKSRHPHPYPAPVGTYLLEANRYPQTGAGYPQTGAGYPQTGT
ncbi:hypothetical protein PCANC_17864 [Puccinia coronata f. sp. avenae]|uniref:Uncharacterized protein n=1 Tax=Puccinia coronata f. sp. avenae TaxID=200324 RepID=A0A2N5U6U5_9BASI|nr:hypothetical protein PCANC_17777 [Puccinia coronata f. sp. avenae]PLW20871.1 hypothetical protein PCASD_15839 [Puccinia coronata f. sp. avenae]PLW33446.1 hypothetical protein PCANC_17864 [Puccinia coronata f. sp. avenae]